MMVLALLGIQAFSEEDGKVSMTEDQKTKIKTVYGQAFLDKFSAELATSEEETTPDAVEALVSAITAHNTAVMQQTIALNATLTNQVNAQALKITEATAQIATLSAGPEDDNLPELDASLPRAEGVPSVMSRKDLKMAAYADINHFMKKGVMNAVDAATIDVADLATEFGTYLSQNSNNIELISTMFQGFTSAGMFTSKMGTTEWRATQALITSVSQSFTSKWTPAGQTQLRPLAVKNRRHKINMPIIPADVLESYAMHMYDEGLSIDQMPITRYIWNELIYPQLMQDIETRMIWKGKFIDPGAVSANDPGKPAEDSMDGIESILADNAANGNADNINFFDGGAFDYATATDDEVLAFVSQFVDYITPVFRRQAMNVHCSHEFWKRYKIAYKNKFGAGSGTESSTFGSDRIDFSNQVLQVVDGMYGSGILFATPKINLIKLRHKNEAPRVINDVQKVDYEVRLFGEYWLGAGFAYGEAVFAFVPDGYDPKAIITGQFGASTDYQQLYVTSGSGSAGGGV